MDGCGQTKSAKPKARISSYFTSKAAEMKVDDGSKKRPLTEESNTQEPELGTSSSGKQLDTQQSCEQSKLVDSAAVRSVSDIVCENRPVTVCNTADEADRWFLEHVVNAGGSIPVALDAEWSPPWFRGSAAERIDVLQIATSAAALVVHTTNIQTLGPRFTAVLSSADHTKIGVNLGGDCRRIERDFGVRVAGQHDLALARHAGGKEAPRLGRGLGDLAKAVLGRTMEKDGGARIGDWRAWPLSPDQVYYAALDVCLTFDVYSRGPEHLRAPLPPPKESAPATDASETPSDGPPNKKSKTKENDTGAGSNANSNFFVMMRNKSIVPPSKGQKEKPQGSAECLAGLCFVVSGVLDSMDRNECHDYIARHGGAVSKSVSNKVTHLLNDHGEVGPAKRKQAEAKGIAIVGEDELFRLVQARSNPEP